jgi:hypothetical protein
MMTVSAEKLTPNKQKQCQQLAPRKHKPDGKALILLSSPLPIRVLNISRTFTYGKRKSLSSLLARAAKRAQQNTHIMGVCRTV